METAKPGLKLREIFSGWDFFEYWALRSFAAVINKFPVAWSTAIARAAGNVVLFLLPKRRRIAIDNLTRAYNHSLSPVEKNHVAFESTRNFTTSLMEFFRIPSMLRDAADRFEFQGTEVLDRAFADGRGVIFVISHLGSWEYLAFLPFLRHYPCSVVVRDTRNPHIFRWIQALRKQTRLNPIPKKHSVRQILSELRDNHLVAILIDQWAGGEGIPAPFFGHATSTTSIPARLARRTGAALVPGYCLRTAPGKYKIIIRPAVPIAEGEEWEKETTLRLNQLLEKEILSHPEQWIWTHRRWKPMKGLQK